jgi:GNAT superfamily N-acetyltransferase
MPTVPTRHRAARTRNSKDPPLADPVAFRRSAHLRLNLDAADQDEFDVGYAPDSGWKRSPLVRLVPTPDDPVVCVRMLQQIRLRCITDRSSRVTVKDVGWFVDHPGIFVWVEDNKIVGFSAADPRDGSIFALFVEEAYERRGIRRALFERACKVLDEANSARMWLTTWPGNACGALLSLGRMAGHRHGRRQSSV